MKYPLADYELMPDMAIIDADCHMTAPKGLTAASGIDAVTHALEAFLGVCHSMAHKLGSFHHLPHGLANALMIDEVLRFNAAEAPAKMGTFPQYDHPRTLARYAEVADYLNLGGSSDAEKLENLIKAIDELKVKVGIKPTIRDYVPDERDFLDRLDAM